MNLPAPGIDRPLKLGRNAPGESAEPVLLKLARVLLDGMTQLALLLTPEGDLLDANQAALAALELTRAQAAGRPLPDLLRTPHPDARRLRAALARAAQGETASCAVKIQGRRGTGPELILELRVRPIADDQEQIVLLVAEGWDSSGHGAGAAKIVSDITERRRKDELQFRLAAIVESSTDAVVSKDLNGIVTSWNPGAERIFGYTAAEMIGQPITKIIPPELYKDESRILATIARGERIEQFETVRIKKNGEPVEISLTVSPVKDENGAIVGAAKIARDITERKKAEQALRTTERLASVGRLAATVAHEINNPLEAVTNLIYLARHAEGKNQSGRYLEMAEEELERISHLTKQTLGFYRETRGATAVRVGGLVNSLLTLFVPRMRNRGIQLTTNIVEDIEVRAIPGEIRQVVANLLSNSIDALDAGGKIHVRISAATQWHENQGRGVRITVADNGGGIAPENRCQLFEPFFTTKKDVGTGLGLWICKSIVENHQGSIRVHSSTSPGRSGTVFSVFLPATTQQVIAPTPMRQ